METTTITINLAEWVLHIGLIWLVISLVDNTLTLYQRYLEWRIKKLKERNHRITPHLKPKRDEDTNGMV